MSIDSDRDGGVATITVSRPDALNAIDLEHAQVLRDTSMRWPRTRRCASSS
jgi:enoyl-CoA hydratase/carnithine racemase